MSKKTAPEPKPKPPIVRVAYKGILDEFKLYADKDGKPFIKLPSGKQAFVTKRRDDTYMVAE